MRWRLSLTTMLISVTSITSPANAEPVGVDATTTGDGARVGAWSRPTPRPNTRSGPSRPNTCTSVRVDLPAPASQIFFGEAPEDRVPILVRCPDEPLPGLGIGSGDLRLVRRRVASADPRDVAEEALSQLVLPTPEIRTSPPPADLVVNFPTVIWAEPAAWTSHSATAAVSGVSAIVAATPRRISLEMGDGKRVVCQGPGTPYDPDKDEKDQDFSCSHRYSRSSAGLPGSVYIVTATVHWSVTWSAAGAPGGGDLGTVSRSTTFPVRVAEIQGVLCWRCP